MHASDKGIDKAYKSAIGGRHQKKKKNNFNSILPYLKWQRKPKRLGMVMGIATLFHE